MRPGSLTGRDRAAALRSKWALQLVIEDGHQSRRRTERAEPSARAPVRPPPHFAPPTTRGTAATTFCGLQVTPAQNAIAQICI